MLEVSSTERLRAIVSQLEAKYRLQRHSNLRDAFWELVFIIISVRTAESSYKPVFRAVRKKYATMEALAAARLRSLEVVLQPAGLSKLKAFQIREAARAIIRDFGRSGLTRSGRREPERIEAYLRGLNGVGAKVAKCVTMYACDAESLPVDAHVWRVMTRLGYAEGGRLTESKALALEATIEPSMRFAVHVLCISHGRAICRPHPECSVCPVAELCPSASTYEVANELQGYRTS